ncbi:hypothetical protein RQP46_000524 [Phenoliferia psychrophenolica]
MDSNVTALKRANEEASDDEAPPSPKRQKASAGRKGKGKAKMGSFAELPLDLVNLIASHSDLQTLLAFSRVNKVLHSILLHVAAKPLWEAARQTSKLPDLEATDFNTLDLANLLYSPDCHICRKVAGKTVSYTFRIRYCSKCAQASEPFTCYSCERRLVEDGYSKTQAKVRAAYPTIASDLAQLLSTLKAALAEQLIAVLEIYTKEGPLAEELAEIKRRRDETAGGVNAPATLDFARPAFNPENYSVTLAGVATAQSLLEAVATAPGDEPVRLDLSTTHDKARALGQRFRCLLCTSKPSFATTGRTFHQLVSHPLFTRWIPA